MINMKRIGIPFLILTLICIGYLAWAGEIPQNDIRIIKVCVLNDAQYPVQKELIKKILAATFQEYKENVGIVFEFDGTILDYNPPDIWLSPPAPMISSQQEEYAEKQKAYLRTICPTDEIRIIFSNLIAPNLGGGFILGQSHSEYGIVMIYAADWEYANHVIDIPLTDQDGNLLTITVLKHEIGHLFGLEHSQDKESFMYCGSRNFGRWTEETIEAIKNNKYRKWQ